MNNDLKMRAVGVGCLVIAAVSAYWGLLRPLAAARAGAPYVEYYLKTSLAGPGMGVLGLFLLISGGRVEYINRATRKLTKAGWMMVAVAMVACAITWWYFDKQFTELGYSDAK